MEISTRSKVSESTERSPQKRKVPTPTDSSNGCSSAETSPSPVKKKKKPGAVSNSKDQSELRHGPFYYKKQPALTTDPVDVVPQDGRNDFYCWLCHREGQVLCCELCPRVYHAKCLKLPSEPEGDWFCPECEKITVAECIETQSRAMMMLTTEQLSYLLKFALQKMKQPGDHPRLPSRSPHAASTQRKTFNWTEPFQKPVSLDQHPDYAEYIFHPMDLCTLEKNIKKKMYGCTEAFLADVKWILHNCIIYNGGNHKLTTTAKVIVKICEHEMSEIEVCPECYLSACQKRDNWFCEPCSHPHPLVWAKLKGFPFWPAKALRDKDGQVDARFFGQHDRAWVPLNNCYLMSKEIPFSVKKTKSIFNSAMQEMEVYVENMKKKFGVFNYARFRTPYTPETNFQMLQDPSNPSSNAAKSDKVDKIKLSFDMTASPKVHLARTVFSGLTGGQCVPLGDIPRSPMSTNSSGQTGSDGEQETGGERTKDLKGCGSTAEESQDSTASQSRSPSGPANSSLEAFPATGKQEKTPPIGSILKLNLDRSKADMDLTELSESVQQKQREKSVLSSPKRQIKSRFQLNLDKTIEICKAQLGIDDISNEEYKSVEHSDSEESGSSDSDTGNVGQEATPNEKTQRTPEDKDKPSPSQNEKTKPESTTSDGCASQAQQKNSSDSEKEGSKKTKTATPACTENVQVKEEPQQQLPEDSDSERELVIDLGEESGSKTRKRSRKGSTVVTEAPANKPEGKSLITAVIPSQSSPTPVTVSSQSSVAIPVTVVSFSASPSAAISLEPAPPSSSITPGLKKQRPLLPRETVPVVQRAVVWSSPAKFQTSPPKWHMQKVQHQDQKQALSASSSPATGNNSRYQTRQHAKAVQQKDSPLSTVTLVSTSPPSVAVIAASGADTPASSLVPETYIPTASADVAEDIARYTNKIMDAIKGTMSELYSDLSKSSSDTTLAEIRRLRIEIEKLQWLHQQELSEMKHNLELTMAEMRQSLEQERERLVSEAKKQMEVEKQQAMDETKKKQWCANCKKEAIFYCCWNTSYCDYPCQQAHWPEHMKSCTQSATSLQQEAEAESTADLPNKSLPQSSGRPNTVHEAATPAASDNSSSVDKSSDSVNMP